MVVATDEAVDDVGVGVLDDVGGDLGGDLLRDDDALPVAAELGERVGEDLDGAGPGTGEGFRPSGGHVAEEAVGLVEHEEVAEAIVGPLGLAVLGEEREDEPGDERLVVVVGQRFEFEDGRGC